MEFFITCNSLPVHVSDSQKGENVILLLHGYLETLYIWEEFTALLSPYMRVVSIDLPGHGLSGSYPINSMANCASTITSVLDKLNIEKAWLLGHSMGGYVAAEAIKVFPDRFLGLIMMNSTPFADSQEKKDNRDREIALVKQNKLQSIVKLSIENMFSKENMSRFEEKIFEIIEIAEVHDPEGIVSSLEGLKQREDNTVVISNSKIPVMFIFGEKDNYISLEVIQEIQTKIPGATYISLKNSGHNCFIEEPKECAQNILSFTKL